MLGKCSATYGVWSTIRVQLTAYICKNSMLEKYIFVGKPILHFIYHFLNGLNFSTGKTL